MACRCNNGETEKELLWVGQQWRHEHKNRRLKKKKMGLQSVEASPRESVIVVMDANRNKGVVDALDWALKHVVRPKDTVVVLGILSDIGKKSSCFPSNMGISIWGIWEKLEFSGQGEVNPRELGEEIERKREQYQNILQPFYRQCKRNEVKLEVKLAAGLRPDNTTVEEAQKSCTRWIVLDSHMKRYKVFIYERVGCNIAVMKRKDVATLIPSKAPQNEISLIISDATDDANFAANQLENPKSGNLNSIQEEEISSPAQGLPPCWYPLSSRNGYPRAFLESEMEAIVNGFVNGNLIEDKNNIQIFLGIWEDTSVMVKSFLIDDERFWRMLMILSRVRHRNIMNLVGYCCTGTSRLMLFDCTCSGTIEMNLQCDESARKLTWRTRWCLALEIGGSLRYLHEECADGPIVHLSFCSSNIVFIHGCPALLGNFTTAKWLKDEISTPEDSSAESSNAERNELLGVDVRDYGIFLIELISGKSVSCFADENSLIGWALPLLENDSLAQLMDPRVGDTCDARAVHHMAQAALLCLKNDSAHKFSISGVLAVVRGDKLALSKS